MPAFFELSKSPSGTLPQISESAAEQLVRRKKIGFARVRRHKEKYIEIDFSFPAGVQLPRFRKYYSSAAKAVAGARDWTEKLRIHGRLARSLDTSQLWVAAECFRILSELSFSDPAQLLHIIREYRDRHPKSGRARTINQVRVELIAKKRNGERRERYVRDFDYKLRCLSEALGNPPIGAVTPAMLEKELARHPDWASGTVHSVVTSWKVIFNYAVRQGYSLSNPCTLLEMPRKRRTKPEILSAPQVHRLLAACITEPHMAACTAYVAIGCFTGIRPDEMQRLRWEMFNLDAGLITIEGEDSKCGERGIVKISPNLLTWLRPIAKESGFVLEENVSKLRGFCRDWLGLKRWPHDGLRHSFASYHYTQHRDIGEVCAQLRHGSGQLVFMNHYYVVCSPDEAAYFWNIVRPIAFLTAYSELFRLLLQFPARQTSNPNEKNTARSYTSSNRACRYDHHRIRQFRRVHLDHGYW